MAVGEGKVRALCPLIALRSLGAAAFEICNRLVKTNYCLSRCAASNHCASSRFPLNICLISLQANYTYLPES